MADLSDVATALVGLVTPLVYPGGTTAPSITGKAVRLYYGWPVPQTLDADLAAGVSHVSVYPRAQERDTTRYLLEWEQTVANTATLTLTGSGQTVTVGGTIPPASNPHNLVVFANGVPYVYQAVPTDSLASIAAALATQISAVVPGVSSSGPTLTLPGSATLGPVRVGVSATMAQAVRNQERIFQIGIWASTPVARDTLAQAIDSVLAATTRLTFPDTSQGKLTYRSSPMMDSFEKSQLFRRDLLYAVEYATLQQVSATDVTAIEIEVSAQEGTSLTPITEFTVYE